MKLEIREIDSTAWLKVRAEAERKLEDARKNLEATNKDATATAVLRGEIKAYRFILAIGVPEQKPGNDE